MNKQQLSEALALDRFGHGGDRTHENWEAIHNAARLVERLLPGECAQCEGAGIEAFIGASTVETGESVFYPCARCSGSGQVWDEGIVEVVAVSIWNGMGFTSELKPVEGSPCFDAARTVLSALAEQVEAGSQ